MNANVDQSDGVRKEIPQINETGNQARSKYFPSHGNNASSGQHNGQQPVQKIKLQQDPALLNRDQNSSKMSGAQS